MLRRLQLGRRRRASKGVVGDKQQSTTNVQQEYLLPDLKLSKSQRLWNRTIKFHGTSRTNPSLEPSGTQPRTPPYQQHLAAPNTHYHQIPIKPHISPDCISNHRYSAQLSLTPRYMYSPSDFPKLHRQPSITATRLALLEPSFPISPIIFQRFLQHTCSIASDVLSAYMRSIPWIERILVRMQSNSPTCHIHVHMPYQPPRRTPEGQETILPYSTYSFHRTLVRAYTVHMDVLESHRGSPHQVILHFAPPHPTRSCYAYYTYLGTYT